MKGRLAVAVLAGALTLTGCGSHKEDACAAIAHIQDTQKRVNAGVLYAHGDSRIDERCDTFETPQQIRDDVALMAKDPARYAHWPTQLAQ